MLMLIYFNLRYIQRSILPTLFLEHVILVVITEGQVSLKYISGVQDPRHRHTYMYIRRVKSAFPKSVTVHATRFPRKRDGFIPSLTSLNRHEFESSCYRVKCRNITSAVIPFAEQAQRSLAVWFFARR